MLIPIGVVIGVSWLLTAVPWGWMVIAVVFIALTGMFTTWAVLGVRQGWQSYALIPVTGAAWLGLFWLLFRMMEQ